MDGKQLGLILRDRGQSLALEAAEDWAANARTYVRALEPGTQLTSETITAAIGLPNPSDPNSNNAVGAVMAALARQGWLRRVGYVPSARPLSHGRVLALWERL